MSKSIPKFKNEDEERAFWSEHDSSEYLNWKSAERFYFEFETIHRAISLRLSESLWMLCARWQMSAMCCISP